MATKLDIMDKGTDCLDVRIFLDAYSLASQIKQLHFLKIILTPPLVFDEGS